MNQQQRLICVAGGSAAVVFLIGYFFYARRRSGYSEDEEEENKHEQEDFADLNARESVSATQTVIKVKVPAYVVGSIIGRGGSNIKQLKAEYGVRFDFEEKDLSSKEKKDNTERILVIRGQRDKAQSAELRIKAIIEETSKYVEEEIFVPQSTCGRIIGKGGQSIRELQATSGAKIVIDHVEDTSSNKRKVYLSGTTVQVDYAKLLIEEKVEQDKAFKAKDKLNQLKDSSTTANSTIFLKDFPVVSLPDGDSYFQVFVSAVDTPDHFWVQVVSKESVKLDEMTKCLTDYYGKLKTDEERLDKGEVGEICVCSFDADDERYRGCIKKILPNGTVDLYYMDFGDSRIVHLDLLKTISKEYLDLPAQAVECYMPIKPTCSNWSETSLDEFEKLTHCAQWIPVMAKVIGLKTVGGRHFPVINLVDTSDEREIDIIKTFVSSGHAVETSEYIETKIESSILITGDEVTTIDKNVNVESSTNYLLFDPNISNSKEGALTLEGNAVSQSPQLLTGVDTKNHGSDEVFDEFLKNNYAGIPTKNTESDVKKGSSLENFESPQNSDSSQVLGRFSSTESDGFVEIDVQTVNGAITAVVNEHLLSAPPKSASTYTPSTTETHKIADELIHREHRQTEDSADREESYVEDDEGFEEERKKAAYVAELKQSLDETSKKNVLSSMELARENLVEFGSDASFNDSFFSARSDVTITDTDDTTSFRSARENVTPTNNLSFSLPDINIEGTATNRDDVTPKATRSKLSGSKFEIQFIDEKTHKVLSRESLNSELESSLTESKKVKKETTV